MAETGSVDEPLEHGAQAAGHSPDGLMNSSTAAHELIYGREATAGLLLEEEARHQSGPDSCAGRVAAAPRSIALEQLKPAIPIRV